MCPSPVLPHAISAQNCAEFEVKHKSNSSWTHSNPGTWKLVLILKWKTDWLVANISPTRTQLKSGTVCTVLLGTQFYAFQIQNQKRFFGKAAWGVIRPGICRSELPRILLHSLKSHFTKLEFQFAPQDNSQGSDSRDSGVGRNIIIGSFHRSFIAKTVSRELRKI